MLISEGKGCTSGLSSQQVRSLLGTSAYANIAPVPEKSESPSPGYMSGSSPAQEIPGQQAHFTFQVCLEGKTWKVFDLALQQEKDKFGHNVLDID